MELQPIVDQAAVQAMRVAIQENLSFSQPQNQSDLTVDVSTHLQKLHLPNFDGNDVLKWPEFWMYLNLLWIDKTCQM